MITQSLFLKNSAYDKDMDNQPMFVGTIDLGGKIYDGELFRTVKYGKEELLLCLKTNSIDAPF